MNRRIGWTSLVIGIATGLVMGLWSFDGPVAVPAWLGAYGDTPRRLARLGHIAFIGLGGINILLARELEIWTRGAGARRVASIAMNIGNVLLPVTLFAAAIWHPAKYAMALPATSVFVALCVTAWSVWERPRESFSVKRETPVSISEMETGVSLFTENDSRGRSPHRRPYENPRNRRA